MGATDRPVLPHPHDRSGSRGSAARRFWVSVRVACSASRSGGRLSSGDSAAGSGTRVVASAAAGVPNSVNRSARMESGGAGAALPSYAPLPIGNSTCLIPPDPSSTV